jgi:D-3-phosphoglycerate dehydrogenase
MKVLITDDVHPLLLENLQQMGFEATYRPDITFDETLSIISSYTGLIINSKIFCGNELLDKARNLRWVGRLGSGMEVIDTKACDARGVKYFNSPEGNRNAVAEHALGLLLDLMNNISKSNKEVKEGKWLREPNRGAELSGKTIGIIAFGNTGQAFAKILSGFDVKMLVYDKYRNSFSTDFVKESTLEEIFEKADIVSLHLPLTEETKYMVDEKFMSSFQKPIYLINTSRGKVIKTSALLAAIHSGKVRAAALDVLENEKLNTFNEQEQQWFDGLVTEERIILTPHIAGWTVESKRKIAEVIIERVKKFL